MNNRLAAERLTLLADYLSKVAVKKFNLSHWMRDNNAVDYYQVHGRPTLSERLQDVNECGTVACACGWATTIPEFNKLGFVADYSSRSDVAGIKFTDADGETYSGFEAAEEFFNIDHGTTRYFFSENNYSYQFPPSRDNVIKRIREYVSKLELGSE